MGPEDAEYAFPEVVLNYIRHLVPGDIKGEIREVSDLLFSKSGCSRLVAYVNHENASYKVPGYWSIDNNCRIVSYI